MNSPVNYGVNASGNILETIIILLVYLQFMILYFFHWFVVKWRIFHTRLCCHQSANQLGKLSNCHPFLGHNVFATFDNCLAPLQHSITA